MFKVPLILLSDSVAQGFTYHSTSTPVISETMINPVTGAIAVEVPTGGSPSHDHGNTTAAPASAITVTATDGVGQLEDITTELQKSTLCPTSPVSM